ncbi:HAD family hydrolase [Candidatus Woesearchaeota archaeon]|jgi:phosphoglycolate phosphatase-like HAD superfamily hydrolase|nr:HAD family hydrolase [Candidatus Woesearchaeota archaeon]MBT4764843.1 HAD family hydrolase [bacterium]
MKSTNKTSLLKSDHIQIVKNIFWDFDGVIKDSVAVKADAFEQLFLPFGKQLAKKVRLHHEEHGGMSRFDKFPLYLSWSSQEKSESLVNEYAKKFSTLVKQQVIDSQWVDGALEYLQNNHENQQFFLVTATPQQEIEEIISELKIQYYFQQVIGSPTSKNRALKILLEKYTIDPEDSIMIGDSSSDYEAALANQVEFILRKTVLNKKLQEQLNCQMIEDFR